jgi:hypothetical protein
MATYEEYMAAARKAHEAGNPDHARQLVQAAKKLGTPSKDRAGPTKQAASELPNKDGSFGDVPEGMVFDPSTGGYVDVSLPHNRTYGDGAVSAAMHGAGQGVSFGSMDEAVGALHGMTGPNTYEEDYAFARDKMRAELDLARDENPVAAYGSEIAGALAVPGVVLKGMTAPSALTRAATGAAVAGTEGALYGFASGEGGVEDRLDDAWKTGAIGAGLGAAAPVAGKMLGRILEKQSASRANKAMLREAPDAAQMADDAQRAFARADATGGLERRALTEAYPEMLDEAVRKGVDMAEDGATSLTPQSARALNRIENAATDPNAAIGFQELDVLRRQAQVPAGNIGNPIEAAAGSRMVSKIDDVIDQASAEAGKSAAEGRKIWGQLRRSEIIEGAIEKAENYASGFEAGLRSQLRRIIENPKLRRGFSKDEIDLMTKVVRGTRTGNLMRRVGKFGIGAGAQTNALMPVLGTEVMGLGAPMAGSVANLLTQRSAQKTGNALRNLVASGGKLQQPQINQLNRLAIENLTRRGVRAYEGVTN